MNREEIMRIIPHRPPMLLVDEAEKKDENSCRGSYTVKVDEWFLQGHFPGKPTVPGVVLCEMMGQACAVILADKVQGSIPYFTGIKNAKFKHPVLPGDTLEIECAMTKNRGAFYFAEGKGSVNGKVCVQAEFSFALVKPEE